MDLPWQATGYPELKSIRTAASLNRLDIAEVDYRIEAAA